ncbi:MAG TPA: alginate export family protein, partial [Gemmataceae bacterium]|nr:alginate export family protein [Gemmataceae bacterium]
PRFAINATPFFDADFRYVDEPGADPDLLERMHRIHIGDDWMFATGGEFRFRYYNEVNSRLTGKDNSYDLTRLRVFGDLWYKDRLRLYVEGIDSQDFNYNKKLAPLLIDRNYGDLLNAFIDLKILDGPDGVPWYVRGGRQELVLGSQRTVSCLDWANTLRTFDGVRLFRHGESLDFDLWWSRPVIPAVQQFDQSDPRQNFVGAWMEYRPTKTQTLDLYYTYLDNTNVFNFATKTPAPVGQFPVAPYNVNTLGYRYAGNAEFNKNILFDFENALQFGHSEFANAGLFAGASTTGLGYNFSQVPMNPTFWAYFDYASGSNNLKSGQQSTFNQLYPFGHYYFGTIDYIGRQNILDWNFHAYLYPTNWLTLNAQLHILSLASATDALYNAAGQIERYDPTGKAGRNVGEELTFVSNFHLTPRQDILVAYSHLYENHFLQATGPGRSAETFWLMYNVRW